MGHSWPHLPARGILELLGLFRQLSASPLCCFFIQQGLNAHSSRFRSEMSAEGVGACESAAATPSLTWERPQFTSTDELLLARMQALMALTVMLAGECLPTNGADERPLIGM